jgi:hypothetical protein
MAAATVNVHRHAVVTDHINAVELWHVTSCLSSPCSQGLSSGVSAGPLVCSAPLGGRPARCQQSRRAPSEFWAWSHVLHWREAFSGKTGAAALPRQQARARVRVIALVMPAGAHARAFGVTPGRHVRRIVARSFTGVADWSWHLLVFRICQRLMLVRHIPGTVENSRAP